MNYRHLCIACIVSLCVACALSCSAAQEKRPARPGAFVRYSVYSVADLVDQVKNNPTVAKRYSSHFGVSQDKLADYFTKNLKLMSLRKPTKVTTYFISKHGRILSKQRTLPAGRMVFVTPGDKLFVEAGCGNPLTKKMPEVQTKVKPDVEVISAPPEVQPVLEPVVEPIVEPVIEPVVPPVVEPVVTPIEAFRGSDSILKFVEVLAPVVAGLQYVQASKDEPSYVPEPGTFATVALASAGLVTGMIRRRRIR